MKFRYGKILIIDDDVTFSLMLRTWLGKKGFGVDTAADIAAGRRLLAEGSYDLVLSDMRLPTGTGPICCSGSPNGA